MAASSKLHLSFEADDAGGTILRVKTAAAALARGARLSTPPEKRWRTFTMFPAEFWTPIRCLGKSTSGRARKRKSLPPAPRACIAAGRPIESRIAARCASTSDRRRVLGIFARSVDPVRGLALRPDRSRGARARRFADLVGMRRAGPRSLGRNLPLRIARFAFELIAEGQPVAIERWTSTPLMRRAGFHREAGPFPPFRFLLRLPRRASRQLLEELRSTNCKLSRIAAFRL